MATLKQKQWQRRGQLLWKLKGINLRYFMKDAPLTSSEKEYLNTAIDLMNFVVKHFSTNSKILGFNVKEKDNENKEAK